MWRQLTLRFLNNNLKWSTWGSWFEGRERTSDMIGCARWFPIFMLLWVTNSWRWCNTVSVVKAAGSPPTRQQHNLFVLTLPRLFPLLSLFPLHLFLLCSILTKRSNWPVFVFFFAASLIFFPTSPFPLSAFPLTYISVKDTVKEARLLFTECGSSLVSRSVGHTD